MCLPHAAHSPQECKLCKGSGHDQNLQFDCTACRGQGRVLVADPPMPCPRCKGTGLLSNPPPPAPCVTCEGTGWSLHWKPSR
jgi:DnaJ-class molecular chaperone